MTDESDEELRKELLIAAVEEVLEKFSLELNGILTKSRSMLPRNPTRMAQHIHSPQITTNSHEVAASSLVDDPAETNTAFEESKTSDSR